MVSGSRREFRWPRVLDGERPAVWFGGDYNPDQWPESVWDEDIAFMKRAHVNLVSVGIFSWVAIEPEDGVFEFDWLDRIITKLGEAGIAVDLASATASPPMWLTQKHPEVLREDERGTVIMPGARQHWRPTSPIFRQYALRLCEQMAEHYKDNPYVVAWHVGNEYGCHNRFDYSPDAVKAFQTWCEHKYETLDAVNDAWCTSFWAQRLTSFDQIVPPGYIGGPGNFPNPGKVLDFKRFCSDALLEFYQAERDTLARITPDIPLTTNFMVSASGTMLDYAKWSHEVDFVSNDHYFTPGELHLDELMFSASLMHGLAGGYPWFLMEHSTSAVNWRPINYRKEPGQLVRDSLAHLALGANAICYFQWRQSSGGAEQFHSAMLPHAGADTQIYHDVCELGSTLGELSDEGLLTARVKPSRVAILVDWNAQWASEHASAPTQLAQHFPQALTWFQGFSALGVLADVLPVEADWSEYDMVVMPGVFLVNQDTSQRLHEYVRSGGNLVTSAYTSIVDDHSRAYLGGYPGLLRDMLGIRVDEMAPMGDDWPGTMTHVDMSNGAKGVIIADVISRLEPDTRVLETFISDPWTGLNELPAVTTRAYGAGTATHVAAYVEADGAATCARELLGELLNEKPKTTELGLIRVERVDETTGKRFIFTFNRTRHILTADVEGRIVSLTNAHPLHANAEEAEAAAESTHQEAELLGQGIVIDPNGLVVTVV